jgi:RNA polymerase-associated protein RTF1
MSDIDDELFALAGGDEDADVEEGEASSVAASSPNSLGSDAMDESDSEREDDVPAKDTDVPYPVEGKYLDGKDKQFINSLPQLEREKILGERAEEQSNALFQAELARRAKGLERSAIGDKKRKASSIEPEDSDRKSSRQKVKGRPNNVLDSYKRDREQRGQQRQRHDDRRNGHRRSSSSDRGRGSDLDAEGESEVDWDDQVKQVSREEEPAELMHFEAVRVGRGLFARLWSSPGFEDVMVGTYVRVGAGQDSQRRTLYKMAKIVGMLGLTMYGGLR